MSVLEQAMQPLVLGYIVSGPPTAGSGGWDLSKLAAIKDIEHGVLYQHGHEVTSWGDADRPLPWASCGRAGASMTSWFREATVNQSMRAALDRSVISLGTATALTFPSHLLLWQALGYIGANGQWHYSNWWREMDDVFFEVVGRKLHDYFNQEIAPRLIGNLMAKENAADGTPRIVGSVRDAVQWAVMMLDHGGDILDADLVRRVLTPGVYEYEALQVHLIRNGKAWEYEHGELLNCDDGFAARDGSDAIDHGHGAICGFPGIDLAFAYRGADLARVLPKIFAARIA